MSTGELYVILGCFGRNDDGFVSCSGCENRILKVDNHIEQYNEMMAYFDACRLFDRPMFEFSAINHFIKNMQDRFDQVTAGKRLWSEKNYHLYQKFIIDHRMCGLYIRLVLIDPVMDSQKFEKEEEEKGVIIKAGINQKKHAPKLNLRLIRGRR